MNVQPFTDFADLRQQAGLDVEAAAKLLGLPLRTVRLYDAGESWPGPDELDRLRKMVLRREKLLRRPTDFRFIDLFAGIGGLRLAMEAAGGKCVFTSEWDRNSRRTYAANFPSDHEIAGDIREYADRPGDVAAHDVLVAGFPCQPFSIAGVSKKNALNRPHGFLCETQGTLFFDVAQLLAHHRPAAFLLENVKNLERHDKGRTFAVIMRTLKEELGYQVHHLVLNARSWVPQKRERIFIVGFREPCGFSFEDFRIPDPDKGPRLGTILEPPAEIPEKYTLTPKLWDYLQAYKEKHRSKGNGFGYDLFGPDGVARTLSARYHKDGSEILIDQGQGKRPRRLTPRECARLMGFEQPGGTEWQIPVSDTQAYRQFGNAVVVQAASAIALHMRPWILEAVKQPPRASHG